MSRSRYFEERPLERRNDASDEIKKLLDGVVDFVMSSSAAQRGAVVGLFGPRGSGKTTVLQLLAQELERNEDAILVKRKNSGEPKLFLPEELSPRADVLSALVYHLAPVLVADEDRKNSVYKSLARRYHPDAFREIAQELATSPNDFERRLVAFHQDLAKDEECVSLFIRDGVAGRLHGVAKAKRVVLLIDDLDLAQRWTFDILESLGRCFRHEGLVTIVTGDRSAFISSIRGGLKRHDGDLRDYEANTLAEALLDKLVPYHWLLPAPVLESRFEYLWAQPADGDGVERVLPRFWAESVDGDLARAGYSNLSEVAPGSSEAARAAVSSFLPSTWRRLKQVHNRLRQIADEIDRDGTGPIGYLDEGHRYPQHDSSLSPAAWYAFRAALASVAVELPSLRLETILELDPAGFFEDLRTRNALATAAPDMVEASSDEVKQRREVHERQRSRWREALERLPLAARLRALDAEDARAGELMLARLAWLHAALETASRELPPNAWTIAISLSEDVSAEAEKLSRDRGLPRSRQLHLDLRAHVPSGRRVPRASDIQGAILEAAEWLESNPVAAVSDLNLVAQAPLPFLVWLGWRFNRAPRVAVWNRYRGELMRFVGPDGPLRNLVRRRSSFEPLELDARTSPFSGSKPYEAILVVGALRPLGPGVFDRFPEDLRSRCAYLWCLERPSPGDIEPEMLKSLLEAIVLALESLKYEHDVRTVHLALAAPAPVAFYVGQQLDTLRPVVLWEFDKEQDAYFEVGPLGDGEPMGAEDDDGDDDDAVVRRRR